MYQPPQFKSDDPAIAAELMRRYPLATLISTDDSGFPFVSHLPLNLEEREGGFVLWGHCARPNSHWRYLRERPQEFGPQTRARLMPAERTKVVYLGAPLDEFARPRRSVVLLGLALTLATTGVGLIPPYLTISVADGFTRLTVRRTSWTTSYKLMSANRMSSTRRSTASDMVIASHQPIGVHSSTSDPSGQRR